MKFEMKCPILRDEFPGLHGMSELFLGGAPTMEGRSIPPVTPARPDGSAVVTRALQLLETIAASERPLALPELCALLELPKATTHRLCQQLERSGYLAREPAGRRYK